VIRITATQFFRPKSRDSEGDVLVDPELLEMFRGYHARANGRFRHRIRLPDDGGRILWPAPLPERHAEIDRLAPLKGRRFQDPAHTLRKEFGSQINARYGLTAASEMLRHADVAVTAAHYVENKQRSVLGFGHLLKSERSIIPIRDEAPRSQAM
jgi:hypothetical protein